MPNLRDTARGLADFFFENYDESFQGYRLWLDIGIARRDIIT